MGDAVISFVVNKLGDFLISEAVFLGGVKKEVRGLKEELGSMQNLLKDAEEKQYGDSDIHKWVSDIKELAYDIEDIIDVFRLKVHGEADDNSGMPKPKSGCFPCVCSSIFDKGKEKVDLYNIGKDIKDFRDRFNDLSSKSQALRLKDSGNSAGKGSSKTTDKLRELRRSVSFAVEENVVGFVDDGQTLLAKLLDDDPRRFIVSIYGMGGLGKTTVARKLYHHIDVQRKFNNLRAWVAVSQDYTTRDLLIRIFKSFGFKVESNEDLEKMDEEDLGRRLHKSLQGHSYLLVIDDVWDKEAWRILKTAFPDNKNGSRVIITTRNEEVAKSSDERTHSHRLQHLKEEESWQLFCEKTSQNFNADEELKRLGEEMVQKCDGLPLAIIVLGGLLSSKKSQEWYGVRDHLWRHLKAHDSIEINSLLALSFDSLPYQLKPCFLYLSLFPEDSDIFIGKLIYLWVAEGFISEDEGCIMEEVAEGFINELINRSLIQVDSRRWGRVFTCRVHDLLRDLAIDKAKKFNFLYIYDEIRDSNISSVIPPCPRQAIYYMTEKFFSLQSNPRLRSLFLFGEGMEDKNKGVEFEARGQWLATMCRTFRYLRVLDSDVSTYPEHQKIFDKEITKLIHLKYLWWSDSRIDGSLICNLLRLQTLVLHEEFEDARLPTEISRLQELRHLIGDFDGDWCLSIDNLTKLQTLGEVSLCIWAQIKTEKLVNLRELWLGGERVSLDGQVVFCFDSIANLKSLRILVVCQRQGEVSFSSLQPLSNCRHLMNLRLMGKLEKVPEDIHKVLPNLECLSLVKSDLEDDPMPLLEKLTKLTFLKLGDGFYKGKKMTSSANGFQWLEILLLYVAYETKEWQVEDGAFPRLKGLHIEQSDNSNLNYPERLRSLPSPNLEEFW